MLSALQFVKDNWVKLTLTWNDSDNNLTSLHNPEVMKLLEQKLIPQGISWSCFFAVGLMLDIYGVYQRDCGIRRSEIVTDIDNFIEKFQPGHIYHFGITDHEFIIIYDHSGSIYYIDYYMETGRGCRQLNLPANLSQAFRLEAMPKYIVLKYLKSYLTENFGYHTMFHHGDKVYHDEYVCSYHCDKTRDRPDSNHSKLEFTQHKITFDPTVSSIIKVIENSITEDDIAKGDFSTPEEIELWKQNYSFVLDALRKAI